jgi:hypothetical protein
LTADDVEQLYVPVLGHRVGFKPSFRAHARRTGWDGALEEFRQACLEAAPAPELREREAPLVGA